jgi:hypothetical protein
MGKVNNIAGICLKEEDNLMNCKPYPNSEGNLCCIKTILSDQNHVFDSQLWLPMYHALNLTSFLEIDRAFFIGASW